MKIVGKHPNNSVHQFFAKAAKIAAEKMGSPWSFLLATTIVIVWGVTGPVFDYSDTWQLVINTGTTIITFLMVFLIQNTQNRDAKAMQLKLDELIFAVEKAQNNMIDIESLSDEELAELQERFQSLKADCEGCDEE